MFGHYIFQILRSIKSDTFGDSWGFSSPALLASEVKNVKWVRRRIMVKIITNPREPFLCYKLTGSHRLTISSCKHASFWSTAPGSSLSASLWQSSWLPAPPWRPPRGSSVWRFPPAASWISSLAEHRRYRSHPSGILRAGSISRNVLHTSGWRWT